LGPYSSAFGLADARAAAARLKVNVQDGKDPAGERRQRIAKARAQPLKTFHDLAEAYFSACESGYWRPRNKKKKAKTIQDERKLLTHGIRPDSVTHTMRDIIAALGLKNASPHDLRRTGATNMVSERLRFAPFIVSQVLGHSSDTGGAAAVTLAHYALYNYAAEKRGALEAWEKLLLEIVGQARRPSLPPGTAQPTLSIEGPAGSERVRSAPWLVPDQEPGFHHRVVLAADHLIRTYGASMSLVELADWIRQELEQAGGAQPLPEDPAL